jgi:BCCT family betaine/carnitine transporter
MNEHKDKSKNNIEWVTLITGSAVLLILGILMAVFPEKGVTLSKKMFSVLTHQMGWIYLWLGMITLVAVIYFMVTKYGRVYLGDNNPTFKKSSILFMTIAAGFGSATMYWIFMESISYYMGPPPGIIALSAEAAEISITASFWHWGFVPWSSYLVCAILVMYTFYIKGKKSFKFSDILNDALDGRVPVFLRKIIDILFVVVTMGALSVTLGLSIPMISSILSDLTGVTRSFGMDMMVIAAIAVVFIASSFVGLEKGMARISSLNIYGCILFLVIVFLASNKVFAMNFFTNGVGLYIREFFSFGFNTDPISNGGFPQGWTIFYLAYWFTFAPFTGIFIAKIAKGHRLKDILMLTMLGGGGGSMLMFMITSSYTMNLELTGKLNCVELMQTTSANNLIVQVLKTLPMAPVMMSLFAIVAILFMATSLDGSAFTLAGVTQKRLDENGNPSTKLKMYWCVALVVFPIILTYAKADLNAIKSVAYVVSFPMVVVIIVSLYGTIKGMHKTFGDMSIREIDEYNDNLCNPESAKNISK